MAHFVSPSILTADFGNLEKEIRMLNSSEADWIHLDIMDGVFVPNISFGFPVIECIKKIATKPLDIHLMIVDPERYLGHFRDAGADILNVHYEACTHLHRTYEIFPFPTPFDKIIYFLNCSVKNCYCKSFTFHVKN
jgi:ribulose-phosphate 3-epimerase